MKTSLEHLPDHKQEQLYFTHDKFPVNGTGSAWLIESSVEECDATMKHSSNTAWSIKKSIAHFYAA